jgi:hypothetical protein
MREALCGHLIVVAALHLELAREKERVLVHDGLVLLLLPAPLELARRVRGRRRPVHCRRAAAVRVRQLDELAVHLILDQPVHVIVSRVIPHALGRELEREVVPGRLVVVQARAAARVPPAAYVAAYEADPQGLQGAAHLAASAPVGVIRHVAAHRARRVGPATQALAVEAMIAHDRHDTGHGWIETFEAHGARGQLYWMTQQSAKRQWRQRGAPAALRSLDGGARLARGRRQRRPRVACRRIHRSHRVNRTARPQL